MGEYQLMSREELFLESPAYVRPFGRVCCEYLMASRLDWAHKRNITSLDEFLFIKSRARTNPQKASITVGTRCSHNLE